MKNKKLIIGLSLLLVIVAVTSFYKWKQKDFLGMSEPQVESKSAIIDYAKSNGIKGDIMIAKNENALQSLEKYFPFGMIYILDADQNLVDCNVEKLGGSCFQDIQDELCETGTVKVKKFDDKISGKIILQKILDNGQIIYNDPAAKDSKIKYHIYYTWVKYSKASIAENSLQFIKCLADRKDVKLININTDMISNY